MSEEIVKEKATRKRGRPKKITPPVVDENSSVLEMERKAAPTVPEVPATINSLVESYRRLESRINDCGTPKQYRGCLTGYNPFLQSMRLAEIATKPTTASNETISTALQQPQNFEKLLRESSMSLSSSQYLYYKILRNAADIPLFNYYKLPVEDFVGSVDFSKKGFQNEDVFVDKWLEALDPKNTFKRLSLEVKRAGKCTYLLRNSASVEDNTVDYVYLQKLPPDYVKLTGIGARGYIASFNFGVFLNPIFSVAQYPPFIQSIWEQLLGGDCIMTPNGAGLRRGVGNDAVRVFNFDKLKDFAPMYEGKKVDFSIECVNGTQTYMLWVQLPQSICYTFCSDTSVPWATPDTAGLLSDLRELIDYGVLAGLIASTPLTAILTGEVEFIDTQQAAGQDQTKLNPETVAMFQNLFNSMTSSNTEAFFAPFKNFKLHTLENVPNSSEIKTRAVQNFLSVAGEGGLVVATEKPSIAQVKGAQLLAESQADFLTRQFQTQLNYIINNLIGCNYKWKLQLWGGIYTIDNERKFLKELVQMGKSFALPKLLSTFGLTMREATYTDKYLEALGLNKMVENVSKISNPVGRPPLEEADITNENTGKSRDLGENVTENKMFDASYCPVCGSDLSEEGQFLCEGCAELYEDT